MISASKSLAYVVEIPLIELFKLKYIKSLLLQAKPWRPRASTALPHPHVWGSHALHPSLWATATLISSSVSRSPTAVMGGAASQSPELLLLFMHQEAMFTHRQTQQHTVVY